MSTKPKAKRPAKDIEGMAEDIMSTLGFLIPVILTNSSNGAFDTHKTATVVQAEIGRLTLSIDEARATLLYKFLGGLAEFSRTREKTDLA